MFCSPAGIAAVGFTFPNDTSRGAQSKARFITFIQGRESINSCVKRSSSERLVLRPFQGRGIALFVCFPGVSLRSTPGYYLASLSGCYRGAALKHISSREREANSSSVNNLRLSQTNSNPPEKGTSSPDPPHAVEYVFRVSHPIKVASTKFPTKFATKEDQPDRGGRFRPLVAITSNLSADNRHFHFHHGGSAAFQPA